MWAKLLIGMNPKFLLMGILVKLAECVWNLPPSRINPRFIMLWGYLCVTVAQPRQWSPCLTFFFLSTPRVSICASLISSSLSSFLWAVPFSLGLVKQTSEPGHGTWAKAQGIKTDPRSRQNQKQWKNTREKVRREEANKKNKDQRSGSKSLGLQEFWVLA